MTAIDIHDENTFPSTSVNGLIFEEFKETHFVLGTVPSGTSFGIRISSNAMEPDYPKGCIIFVKSCIRIKNNKIGVFAFEGTMLCRRLEINKDINQVRLLAINPDYEPIIILPEQMLFTYGEVLGYALENEIVTD